MSALPLVVLLAASCWGEASHVSHSNNECAGLTYVYVKRAAMIGETVRENAMRYSAVLKTNRYPWMSNLTEDGSKPKGWPKNMKWSNYREHWLRLLETVNSVLNRTIPDPYPTALHYGGWFDVGLDMTVW